MYILCQGNRNKVYYINKVHAVLRLVGHTVHPLPKMFDLDFYDRNTLQPSIFIQHTSLNLNLCLRGCAVTVSSTSQPTLTWQSFSALLLCCFFSSCCLTYEHMARSDTYCQSTSPRVHLFLACVVSVGIKLLTQDLQDVPDNLNHGSVSLKRSVGHQQRHALFTI